MKRQNGFAHVQMLLILVAIVAIGGVGFLVYNARKTSPNAEHNAAKAITTFAECAAAGNPVQESFPERCIANGQTFINDNKTADTAVPEENSWLLFTPEDKVYSVRVPDGWETVSLNGNLYNRKADKMAYKKGTKATVEMLTEGGWDGAMPFSLINPGIYHDEIVRLGTESGTVKTDAGLTAHKYIYIEEKMAESIGYAPGTKVYNYYFDIDGKHIQVTHAISPGQTDQHELVERLIKTIKIL